MEEARETPGMEITILAFEGMTPLDAVGPFEVLGRLPGAHVRVTALEPGPQRTSGGSLALVADYALTEVSRTDILLIPGGPGADALAEDVRITGLVARLHETTRLTASVCTGALILGAAGVLKGLRAVTHWRAMDALAGYGAQAVNERVVWDGKVVSCAGVSAGIDMALQLAAELSDEETARAIQLAIEYAPQPPFDGGRMEGASGRELGLARHGLNQP